MSFTFGTQAQGQLDDSRSREESQEAWKNKLAFAVWIHQGQGNSKEPPAKEKWERWR